MDSVRGTTGPGRKKQPRPKGATDQDDRNTDRLVSIVKAIENEKIDRILGMMLVLFDHGAKRKSPPEPKLTGINSGPAREGDDTGTGSDIFAVQEEKHRMRDELTRTKKDFYLLMDQKAKVVRPVLGKPYVRLNIPPEEFENLKQKYKTD